MPLWLDRDDINRRLKLTINDPITATELITSAERQLAEGAWLYGTIVDGRAMTVVPTVADLRLFISHVRELVVAHGPRGSIAFVTRQSAAIGIAQIYILFAETTDSVEVFWDMPEARRWLDEQMTRPLPAH